MEEPEKELDPNFEAFFADAPYLLQEEPLPVIGGAPYLLQEEGEGAPPPFALPPPPRPPWLDLEDSCTESSPLETCDNIIIIDSQVHLEETFQNLIIIAVCSALLVIMLVFSVACIWRSVIFESEEEKNNIPLFPSKKHPISVSIYFHVTGCAVLAQVAAGVPMLRRTAKVQEEGSN